MFTVAVQSPVPTNAVIPVKLSVFTVVCISFPTFLCAYSNKYSYSHSHGCFFFFFLFYTTVILNIL